MSKLTNWITRIAAASFVTGGLIAACHETPSTPVTPVPHEAPPLGDRPTIDPAGAPETSPGAPMLPIPAQNCADGARCPDAGVAPHPGPVSMLQALGAQPAAAPADAGVDAVLPPEVPDAPPQVLPDGGKPM